MKLFVLLATLQVIFAAATTTPRTTARSPKPGCIVTTADIGFIVDSSGSISDDEWRKSLNFIARLVQSYDIGDNAVRVGLIEFSNNATIQFDFNEYNTSIDIRRAIRSTYKTDGSTSTDTALDLARTQLFTRASGARSGVPNVLFVITDGESNDRKLTEASARRLHNMGITVFAIGVQGAKIAELAAIASNQKYVYSFSDFNKLAQVQDQFARDTCNVAVKLTPPPPRNDCIVKTADIGFIVDASGSISDDEWRKSLDFIARLVQSYDIGDNAVRVGLIEFSDNATIQFDFDTYNTSADIRRAIRSTYKTDGSTNTDAALDLARTRLFTWASGARSGVPNVLFVLTDGESNDGVLTAASARALHKLGVTVFAVGIQGAKRVELGAIASDPKYVYSFADFNTLVALQDKFARDTCKVAVKLTPPPPRQPDCVVKTADIGFIVDASGSISGSEYRKSLEFIARLVETYDVRSNGVRVGLIHFSDSAATQFGLNQYTTSLAVRNAILATSKSGGGTNTHLALDIARQQLFNSARGDRPGVPNILFVLTDGESNDNAQTVASAKRLHNAGVTVFAIGIGNADQSELVAIASDRKYVYTFSDFNKLAQIQDKFARDTCEVAIKQFACPVDTVLVASKETKSAVFTQNFDHITQDILLYIGRHYFNLEGGGRNCSFEVAVLDYNIRHRLDIKAEYNVKCSLFGAQAAKILLASTASHKYKQITEICPQCQPPSDQQVTTSCEKDVLTVTWPTGLLLPAKTNKIPVQLSSSLKKALSNRQKTMDLVIYFNYPPVVYPRLNSDGTPIRLSLTTVCSAGMVLSGDSVRCQMAP